MQQVGLIEPRGALWRLLNWGRELLHHFSDNIVIKIVNDFISQVIKERDVHKSKQPTVSKVSWCHKWVAFRRSLCPYPPSHPHHQQKAKFNEPSRAQRHIKAPLRRSHVQGVQQNSELLDIFNICLYNPLWAASHFGNSYIWSLDEYHHLNTFSSSLPCLLIWLATWMHSL